jgi:hypothetical protein
MLFIVVNGNKNHAGIRQEFMQNFDAWPHHGEPFVMSFEVFLFHRVAGLLDPLAHERAADVVVVTPTFVAGVIGRVNVDAVHLAGIHRQQRLERVQIVPVNNQVVFQ